jgi:hypothetical protein
MKIKIIALPLLLAFMVLSCKKEDPLDMGNNPDGNLVLSQVTIDNQPAFEYTYNESNLISEERSNINFSLHHYNSQNQLVSTDIYSNFDAISSDSSVSKSAMAQNKWVTPANGNKGGTINYEYNNNGQLIKSTFTPASGSSEYSEFTYGPNNKITKQILYWKNKEIGYIDYSYDGKGNLVKEILYDYVPSTGAAEISSTTLYEFDNKINPYKSFGSLMIPGIETNVNNITKETYTIHMSAAQGGDKELITRMTYTYNTYGYPVSRDGNVGYIYN